MITHDLTDTNCFKENIACEQALLWVSLTSGEAARGVGKGGQRVGQLAAVKREKFAKNKKTTSKERLLLLLFKACYFTSILLIY